jgi:hypothetical protein
VSLLPNVGPHSPWDSSSPITTTTNPPKERKEEPEDIVDADVHVHKSPGELVPYCDMPWRKAV